MEERTIEQINEEIQNLVQEREAKENENLENKIYGMFSVMSKEDVLVTIKQMMDASPMLKSEVKRLLITEPLPTDDDVV